MIIGLLTQFLTYMLISIVIICFFVGFVLILNDVRLSIYRIPIFFKRIKQKVASRFSKSNERPVFHIKPLFRDKIEYILSRLLPKSPYRMTIYSFVFIILFLYYQNKYTFSQTFMNYFIIVFVFVFIDFLTKLSISIVTIGLSNNFIFDVIYVIIYIAFLTFSCFVGLLILIDKGQNINFVVVLIILAMILIPLRRFATVCINAQKRNFNIVIIILIFLLFEVTIYLLFGTYNISIDYAYRSSLNTNQYLLGTRQIIQAGTQYIFTYPEPPVRIEYTVQYLIGFFVHVIMLGFYISIISSKILQINVSRKRMKLSKKP